MSTRWRRKLFGVTADGGLPCLVLARRCSGGTEFEGVEHLAREIVTWARVVVPPAVVVHCLLVPPPAAGLVPLAAHSACKPPAGQHRDSAKEP